MIALNPDGWAPYVPPWYPDLGPLHNPFASAGDSGPAAGTFYEKWRESLKPGELARLIEATRS